MTLIAGKGIPNVPPGVAPLLGTQYIMSQAAGLPAAFYPLAYDVQIPNVLPGRDHSFAYTATGGNDLVNYGVLYSQAAIPPDFQDIKYSRSDDATVSSTQTPVSQAHNQPIISQFPPGYGFFYTPNVGMMPQPNLYGPAAAAPIFPMTAQPNHGGSANSGFPKGTAGFGSHSYPSAAYDPLTAVPQHQDYVKQSYPTSAQQVGKGVSGASSNELGSNPAAMYGKSHAQMSKVK